MTHGPSTQPSNLLGYFASPASPNAALLSDAVIVLTGTLLITLSARVQVPMWPVPMTMQTFAVLLLAMSMGARLAAVTLGFYLFQGAIGLPVFATGGGLAYLASPTAGFLIGFLAAAAAVGWLADRGYAKTLPGAFATALAGCLIIYTMGAGYLALHLGLAPALQVAVLPFVLSDILKSALVAVLLASAHGVLARRR
jgi:biotin transport system substrate-specific component